MNICFSLSNLEAGGAQTFVVRLAAALSARGHKVMIYDHQPEIRDKRLLNLPGSGARVYSYSNKTLVHYLTWKLNGLLAKLRIEKQFHEKVNKWRFQQVLRKHKIAVVNSHMSRSDFIIASCKLPAGCVFVPSLHGEYELMRAHEKMEAYFLQKIREVTEKAAMIIYTADKNLEGLTGIKHQLSLKKINVGFDPSQHTAKLFTRAQYHLKPSDFVVGMVSRGIPEKGWDTAIKAIQQCRQRGQTDIVLLMIGTGPYLRELHATVNDPAIQLLDFANNYADYFYCYRLFDLLIFPSRFKGESVPNAVIEALSQQVPVVASHIAEIPAMIAADTPDAAGICISQGEKCEDRFAEEISALYADRQRLQHYKTNCAAAFEKFNMQKVAARYLEIFENLRPSG